MNRYRRTEPLDEPAVMDGDGAWTGVNMRLEPSALPPGMVAAAVNMRFSRGVAEPRRGKFCMTWSNLTTLGDTSGTIKPYGVIHGVGVFSDPDDREWIVVAADGVVYRTREGSLSAAVTLPAGVVLSGEVSFTQAIGDLILFRGESASPLRLTSVDAGFAPITMADNDVSTPDSENPFDGTEVLPNADRGLFLSNRLFVAYDRDLVAVSDFLNYTRFQPQMSVFRINQGSADGLVALVKFNETTIIAAKAQSIYRVANVYGDLSEARLDEITREYGCRAPKSFAQVGADLWFLADRRGVTSIIQTDQDKLQAVDQPVSADIQPLIDRINWNLAGGACAAYFDNRYYLAVPLDNGREEKASLVPAGAYYDQVTGTYSITTVPGRVYRYVPGANENGLVNGTEVLTSEGDFTAQSTSVQVRSVKCLFYENFDGSNGDVAADNFTGLQRWTVSGAGVDLVGNGSTFNPLPAERMYLDLKGTAANGSGDDTVLTGVGTVAVVAGTPVDFIMEIAPTHRTIITPTAKAEIVGKVNTGFVGFGVATGSPNAFSASYTPVSNESVQLKITGRNPSVDNIGLLLTRAWVLQGTVGASYPVTASVKPVFIGNNAVLVYDFLNRAWAGVDQGESGYPLLVKDWVKHTYNGVRRLFAVTADGFIALYEEGVEEHGADQFGAITARSIVADLTTRGYAVGVPDVKRFMEARLNVRTWNPRFTVSAQFDGANESVTLKAAATKSRTRYFKPFDRAAYDVTNVNLDHATPYREDYSVALATGSSELTVEPSGVEVELHQESVESVRVNRSAKYCQVRVTCDQGRCEVRGVSVTASPGARGMQTQG